jgi:hypothetical protein
MFLYCIGFHADLVICGFITTLENVHEDDPFSLSTNLTNFLSTSFSKFILPCVEYVPKRAMALAKS